jgi:leader peptidase (prepilin peptidase)/N-methyltransferase
MSLNLWAAFGIGLILGSFVNVLVHRLPRMVMASYEPITEYAPRFDLWLPASHCPHCHTPLQLKHLLPVLSYVWLKGRCGFCKHPIGWQYPAVEILTGLIWIACVWHWGMTSAALCWALFSTSLLALSLIDWQTTFLPDALTQPLLWLGLIASAAQWVALPLTQAVWGAVWGYAALWSVATLFERITGKQGMGGGDFKLLAALGAWLGPLALIPLVIISSLTGAIVGLSLQKLHRLPVNGYVPFGPFLAAAGAFLAWYGPASVVQSLGWPTF